VRTSVPSRDGSHEGFGRAWELLFRFAMNKKPRSKLRASREVLVNLTDELLDRAAGGALQGSGHCPAPAGNQKNSTTSASVVVR
jgi:hypothetical protein